MGVSLAIISLTQEKAGCFLSLGFCTYTLENIVLLTLIYCINCIILSNTLLPGYPILRDTGGGGGGGGGGIVENFDSFGKFLIF